MSKITYPKSHLNNLIPLTAFFCLFFMILFLGGSLSTLTTTNRLLYTTIIFLGFVIATQEIKNIKTPSFFIYYFFFFAISLISFLFAKDSSLVLDELIPIITVILIFIGLINYTTSKEKLVFVLNIFLFTLILVSFYYLYLTSFNLTRFRFLPKSYNTIAIEFFSGFIYSFLLGIFLKNRFYFFASGYFSLFIFAAASVKVIACLVLLILMCLIYYFKFSYNFSFKIKFRFSIRSVIISLMLVGLIYGISVSGVLDRSTRRAINTILLVLFNDSQYQAGAAGSVELRGLFLEKGIQYWLDSPIFGHGLNNYRYLFNEDFGTFTYSHSTPIELIVGLGAVGFGLFYFFLFKLLRKGISSFWQNKSFFDYFLVVAFSCFVIIGLGQRIYSDYVFFVFLSVYYILIFKRNHILT